MGMQRFWNAGQPGQRSQLSRCERCEAPVEDGRHVVCGSKVASAGSSQHMAQRMLSGFGGEGEQVGSQGRPSRFSGKSGNVLVGFVELCDGLGSEELFGCDVRLSV
jgi:hypothetical protein